MRVFLIKDNAEFGSQSMSIHADMDIAMQTCGWLNAVGPKERVCVIEILELES